MTFRLSIHNNGKNKVFWVILLKNYMCLNFCYTYEVSEEKKTFSKLS